MTAQKPVHPGRLADLDTTEKALEDLLGTLLADVPEHTETAMPDVPVAEVPRTAPAVAVKTPPEVEPAPSLVPEPVLNNVDETSIQVTTDASDPVAAPVLPEWAEPDFKVLLVRIGEMRFAVPLICLSGIARPGDRDEVADIPGQPAWHKGVMRYREKQLVLADLGLLLDLRVGEVHGEYLLLIGDGRLGLQCDAIEEQLTMQASKVNWRQPGDRREWSLGVLPEKMCVLLDLDQIASRLPLTK